jgi:chromosomal replication initiation ATPase DnaA
LIDRWPEWPSPVVILAGPTGSGKSHLAGIWAGLAGAAGSALAPAPMAIWSRHARAGAHRGCRPPAFDETALFHLINAVRENGTALLITAVSGQPAGR